MPYICSIKIKHMEKGQIIIVKTIGNAARYGSKIFEAEVVSIGRKYFTIKSDKVYGLYREKFLLEDLSQVSEYSSDYRIYLSWEELEQVEKRPLLTKEIIASLGNISFENLIKIQEFIKTL